MQTGTLKELNVQVGDAVECVEKEESVFFPPKQHFTIGDDMTLGRFPIDCITHQFRIVSRASDTPKTWGEMTAEEKGALLLADLEGKVVEASANGKDGWVEGDYSFNSNVMYYRVKPEPQIETVSVEVRKRGQGCLIGSGTIDLIDGKPDVNSIKMEEL